MTLDGLQELRKHLKLLKVSPESLRLPTDDYDAVKMIKTGFVYEFLRVVLIRPVATGLRDPEALLRWHRARGGSAPGSPGPPELPKVEEVFKGGQSYVSFIYL